MQQVAVNHPWHPYSPKGVTKGEDDSPWHRPVSTAQCAASGAGCGSAKGPSGHSWHPSAAQTPSRTTYCPVPSPLHKHWDGSGIISKCCCAACCSRSSLLSTACPQHSHAGVQRGSPRKLCKGVEGPNSGSLAGAQCRRQVVRWVCEWVGGWMGGWMG